MDESELQAWVESETGSAIQGFTRAGTGASRATWLVELDGDPAAVVLRADSGDGPLSGTALDLSREAAIYRALARTAVRIPRLLSEHPAGRAVLIERALGTDGFATAADDAKPAIALDYMHALAELHRLDADALDLDPESIAKPASREQCAQSDLALWRGIFEVRAPGDPLVGFAGGWLENNAPRDAERVSLCHGDAGPGNFLFDATSTRVTALLDWEFAHLGDPLDDLAWIAVRSQLLGGFGNAKANWEEWTRRAGLRVDRARLEYYRAVVLWRMAISCLAALAHAGDSSRAVRAPPSA